MSRDHAHRVAWERVNGPIPDGLTIDHVLSRGCVWKDCVEVAHMECVTMAENIRRSPSVAARIAATHCPQGHPYSGDNLIVRTSGRRACRECGRVRFRRWYWTQKAQDPAWTQHGHLDSRA